MTTTAHERAESRRDQILDQALRILGERGYHGFDIQELAERCGLTKPGLLHHFGSKERLLIAVLNDRDRADQAILSDQFLPEYDAAPSAKEQRETFSHAMSAMMARRLASPDLIRLDAILRAEAINPDHPAHEYFLNREDAKRERFARRIAPFCTNPDVVARQILALLTGLQEQWLREGASFDMLSEWNRGIDAVLPR